MATNTNDQRRHERFEVPICAWLTFPGHTGSMGTVCLDLSQEGARFSGLEAVAPGTSLLVDLQLQPGGCVVECKGRACWSALMENGLHQFGVRFIDLAEEEADGIARFLDESRPEPALAAV